MNIIRTSFKQLSSRFLPLKSGLQRFSNTRFVKHPKNFVKVHATVIGTPVKSLVYCGAAYGIFCIVYCYSFPQSWQLSDHNVQLTGIVRVVRTVLNALFLVAAHKYYFWNVEYPEDPEETLPFQNGDEAKELSPELIKYKEVKHAYWELASNRIAKVFLTNGGVYIKVGQAMATYAAMLPPEMAAALKPLLSSIFERQSGEVQHMFVQDLGDTPDKVFSEFQQQPIAGASIAQVFVGKTKEGQKVAIKVQYFDISKRFKMDKWTCLALLHALDWYSPGVPFLKVMPHIFDNMEKEMDFVSEGTNSEICAKELKHIPFLSVPKVHWNLSSKRILTMDFVDGIDLTDAEKVTAAGFNSRDVMTKVVKIFAEQIFKTGTIHCDPHPGNILVRKNVATGKTEIVLIDHGFYERFLPHNRKAFASFWHSIIIDDYEEVQRSGNALGLKYPGPDMLASLLFFSPYGMVKTLGDGHGGNGWGSPERGRKRRDRPLTEEEKQQLKELQEYGHETVNNLPTELAMIFRNLRLIQGINLSFGVPVNRIRLMAETALENTTKESSFFLAVRLKLKFEWHFLYLDIRNELISWGAWIASWFVKPEPEKDLSKIALFLKA